MAVRAIARITSVSVEVTTTDYTIVVGYDVRDGSNAHHGGSATATISSTTDSARANRMLRQAVADSIFADFSLTIDPGDIYCPSLN